MLKTGIVINIRWAQVLNLIKEENVSSPAPEETKEVRPSVNRAVRNYAKERNVRWLLTCEAAITLCPLLVKVFSHNESRLWTLSASFIH